MKIALLSILLLAAIAVHSQERSNSFAGSKWTLPELEKRFKIPTTDTLFHLDLKKDLRKKSIQELRLLRWAPYARQGYILMDAEIRGFYSANTCWYDSIMESRYWANEEDTTKVVPSIELSSEENAFVSRADSLINLKKKNNFENNTYHPNISNIVNLFQFEKTDPAFLEKLNKNGFAILESNNDQLFHVYEANDYHQIPNFVTTDLFLQLYHMYFSYVLRNLEKTKLITAERTLVECMYAEAMKVAKTSSNPMIKDAAEYTATFYAIPVYLLSGVKKPVPTAYQAAFNNDLRLILAGKDDVPKLIKTGGYDFPFSLFKPRGHYAESEKMKKYFMSTMWLQHAFLCREDNSSLLKASFSTLLLNKAKDAKGKSAVSYYKALYETISFLVGEPDNLSFADLSDVMQKLNIRNINQLENPDNIKAINSNIAHIALTKNKIRPKNENTCRDKINLIPARYLIDNEILQEMVDTIPNAERAYPRAIDYFAAAANKFATDLQDSVYHDPNNWSKFLKKREWASNRIKEYRPITPSVYDFWLKALNKLQVKDNNYPSYMQTEAWDKKNLNTSLASYTELKHDVILYAEQPQAAECGGGGPPDPICFGYVEPNVNFWGSMSELIKHTDNLLKRLNLYSPEMAEKSKEIQDEVAFLLSASRKELKGLPLSEEELRTIEIIGASVENLTLSIIEDGKNYQDWTDVKGTGKSIAVTTDIYTRNISGCKKNGVLHLATGQAN
ncbi:MAG: DUF3160 domain-containing protein, partial [Bacteroidota bacterium]|nr:DUF3160 domain-containing protein [Bacteroidota bacterium]